MVLARDCCSRGVQVDNVYDEIVRVDHFDPQRLRHFGREVFGIAGHNSCAAANDSGSQNVPVSIVGQLDAGREPLVSCQFRVGEELVHLALLREKLSFVEVRESSQHASTPFSQDLGGPVRLE